MGSETSNVASTYRRCRRRRVVLHGRTGGRDARMYAATATGFYRLSGMRYFEIVHATIQLRESESRTSR